MVTHTANCSLVLTDLVGKCLIQVGASGMMPNIKISLLKNQHQDAEAS